MAGLPLPAFFDTPPSRARFGSAYQSFLDERYFPTFKDCPRENVWDDRYMTNDGEEICRRSKYWCLLGHIVRADNYIRPVLRAEDRQGAKFTVAFYPGGPDGMQRVMENYRVGNTIAILWPLVHQFMDGSVGIRVEEPREVLV